MSPRCTLPIAVPGTRRLLDRAAGQGALSRSLAAWTLGTLSALHVVAPLRANQTNEAPARSTATAEVATSSPGLLVVDASGVPVPGVQLTFIDRLPGTSLSAKLLGGEPSDERGWIRWAPGATPEALDVRSADPRWAVAYLHAERTLEAGEEDVQRLATIDFNQLAVCVLERTGTLEIEVVGAQPGDRFHATWTDARPEHSSHRKAQSSASFTGPRGRLRARAGRGDLYLTRDGALGAAVLRNGSPLLISVVPGETSQVRVRLEEGPSTLFLAPFDTIQFQRLQALAPDGELVVADLDFESSPLRVPSVLPVSVSGDQDERPGARPRLPKHLMRAVDAPTSLSSLGGKPTPPGGTRPGVERAPVLVVFPVDLGGKLRFPEVEQGWIRLAQQGNLFLVSQPFHVRPGAAPLRSAPGSARLDRLNAGRAESTHPAEAMRGLSVVTPEGKPAGLREVLVVDAPWPAFRALTDQQGHLEVHGALGPEVEVMALENLADRVTLGTQASGEDDPVLVLSGAMGTVRGDWSDPSATGRVLMLIPQGEELGARVAAGTRAVPLCVVDSRGRFHFGPVPAGDYQLRVEGEDLVAVQVRRDATEALKIEGAPPEVRVSR